MIVQMKNKWLFILLVFATVGFTIYYGQTGETTLHEEYQDDVDIYAINLTDSI